MSLWDDRRNERRAPRHNHSPYFSSICSRVSTFRLSQSNRRIPMLSIVFAALAVTRFVENATGWSIKRFVRTARGYRTVQIRVGAHSLTAEDPLPPDLRDALAQIN